MLPGQVGRVPASANSYAMNRLLLAKRAGYLPGNFTPAPQNAAAQWRSASQGLAGAAQAAGFQHPMNWLRQGAIQGKLPQRPQQPQSTNTYGGVTLLPGSPALNQHPQLGMQQGGPAQPEDNGQPAGAAPVMAFRNGKAINYGTDEAKALALKGLQAVNQHFGMDSPQWSSALEAALGVLGPDYQAPAGAFGFGAVGRSLGNNYKGRGIRNLPKGNTKRTALLDFINSRGG